MESHCDQLQVSQRILVRLGGTTIYRYNLRQKLTGQVHELNLGSSDAKNRYWIYCSCTEGVVGFVIACVDTL